MPTLILKTRENRHTQAQTQTHTISDTPQNLYSCAHPYLEDQGDAGREEGHEDKVVGQDRHAAKTTHDLQLSYTWKINQSINQSKLEYCIQNDIIFPVQPALVKSSTLYMYSGAPCSLPYLTWCPPRSPGIPPGHPE